MTDVSKWSVENVVAWAESNILTQEYKSLHDVLRDEQYNGNALLGLTLETLTDLNSVFKLKHGPATNIMRAIKELTHRPVSIDPRARTDLPQDDIYVALNAVLQPIEFPRSLDEEHLKTMLATPPIKIFGEDGPFTSPTSSIRSTDLYKYYEHSLHRAALPDGTASETVWSGYWDEFVTRSMLAMAIACAVLRGVQYNRNVEDDSITQAETKRDFLLWGLQVLLLCGEDKRDPTQLKEAKADLESKNKGFSAAAYGPLEYILCFATAGEKIQFFALPSNPKPSLVQLTGPLDITVPSQREQVLAIFLNIFRWVRSVLLAGILASHFIKFKEPVVRPSPYKEEPGTIVVHHNYVEKVFYLPHDHYDRFELVYKFLVKNNQEPFMISVEAVWCMEAKAHKGDNRTKFLHSGKFFTPTMRKQNGTWLRLILGPVGARFLPDQSEVKACFTSLLSCLSLLHNAGLTHRDVRWPNILRANGAWLLIDFELAAANDSPVFWSNEAIPLAVRQRERNYVYADDLRQLRGLFCSVDYPNTWQDFVSKLGDEITTAQQALEILSSM